VVYHLPIYIAGVNRNLARLAGELCDGFHVYPFHSPEYVRAIVKPAIAEGAWREGRDSEAVELSTSDFAVAGENKEEVEDQRDKMRAQISSYASTPTYRTVLEAHGWTEVGEKLGWLARARGKT
jgi:alkanesulfonate monooxygenase SsuD/methylene tetrahydromethanopterin reductase-like flavin-dependent oxidoreductase (luciferase family)